jgi:hypothetical protein
MSKPVTGIFIGTALQKRLFLEIQEEMLKDASASPPLVILLEDYYQFKIDLDGYPNQLRLRNPIAMPWYDQHPLLKLFSLVPYIFQLYWLSRKCDKFVFFVDTGVLERTAIKVFNKLECRTIVIQDALKRIPKNARKKALTWFGSADASLYLLTGRRYVPMITNRKFAIVGSPIYKNNLQRVPPGKKILIINQCFARYGEMKINDELAFMEDIVKTASNYGQVELRLHPHNDPMLYKHIESDDIDVTQKKPLVHSLEEAGIVIGVNSTVLLEAMTMMRPMIVLEWHPSPYFNPIAAGTVRCRTISEMCAALERWKNGERMVNISELKKEIDSHITYTGRDAIHRIISKLSTCESI